MVDQIECWSYPSLRACCRACECLYLEGTVCAAKSRVSSATLRCEDTVAGPCLSEGPYTPGSVRSDVKDATWGT